MRMFRIANGQTVSTCARLMMGGCLTAGLAAQAPAAGQHQQPAQQPPRHVNPLASGEATAGTAGSATRTGGLETVATFDGPIVTGVTVSRRGRIFVNFPRWLDSVEYSVAEVRDGKVRPYPDTPLNKYDKARPAECLVSVQSVVVDPLDRLWIVDTGSINFGPVVEGGPKLVCVDLKTDEVLRTITFPPDVVLKTTYLNDIRFDLRQGQGGVAYITDSSVSGPNGIIVVDLLSGSSRRRLHDHASTKADADFRPVVEGEPLMMRPPGKPAKAMTIGSDGIALSQDGQWLYYCPLSSRRLHRVPTGVLLDETLSDALAGGAVEDVGERDFASDGLEHDNQGWLYLTDYEHNAVQRRNLDGSYEVLVSDPRALWPDTMSIGSDGYLYFIANQLHRQPQYHEGRDLRKKPYHLFRVKIDAGPALLMK